jgi:hypothetical protein
MLSFCSILYGGEPLQFSFWWYNGITNNPSETDMAFGIEKYTPGNTSKEKAELPVGADPGRRKFLRDATIVLAGTAVGVGALPKFLSDGMGGENANGRIASKEEPESGSAESENVRENPMDELISYEGGVQEIGEKELEALIGYWVWQYTEGAFSGDFQSAIDGLRHHLRVVKHEFDEARVPRELALVSIFESYWNEKTCGEGGPFQISEWAAERFGVNPKTVRGSAEGAAKLFAEILDEVGAYSEPDEGEKFGVLRYNARYLRKYVKSLEDRGNGDAPTLAGFLAFMSERAEAVRKQVRTKYGNSSWGRKIGKREFDADIQDGAFGIRINIEYLAKYEAAKRIFETESSLAGMLRSDRNGIV